MLISKSIVKLSEPKESFIINLDKFSGSSEAATKMIPSAISGIYSWFNSYHYSDDPETFYNQLIEDLNKPKFYARSGAVKPFYEVTVSSKNWISDDKKKRLQEAAKNNNFRTGMQAALASSIFFQAPLYVGKSNDLRRRISDHLKADSILRIRLDSAKIDIDKCSILIVPTSSSENCDDCLPIDEGSEDLYEEVFSRLFSPLFTIRIG